MPLPRSFSENGHGLPELKNAKKVNTHNLSQCKQETVVLFVSKICLGWEQILQILLLALLEVLSAFCLFYNEESLPFCRADKKVVLKKSHGFHYGILPTIEWKQHLDLKKKK